VKNGQRLEWPKSYDGPSTFKDLACDCWHQDPNCRPTLDNIIDALELLRKEEEDHHAIDKLSIEREQSSIVAKEVVQRAVDQVITHNLQITSFINHLILHPHQSLLLCFSGLMP
jgi:hypothetical protein